MTARSFMRLREGLQGLCTPTRHFSVRRRVLLAVIRIVATVGYCWGRLTPMKAAPQNAAVERDRIEERADPLVALPHAQREATHPEAISFIAVVIPVFAKSTTDISYLQEMLAALVRQTRMPEMICVICDCGPLPVPHISELFKSLVQQKPPSEPAQVPQSSTTLEAGEASLRTLSKAQEAEPQASAVSAHADLKSMAAPQVPDANLAALRPAQLLEAGTPTEPDHDEASSSIPDAIPVESDNVALLHAHETLAPEAADAVAVPAGGMSQLPDMRVIRLATNSGAAAARNAGISCAAACGAQVVCFLDLDCLPHKTWIDEHIRAQAKLPGLVFGRTYAHDKSSSTGMYHDLYGTLNGRSLRSVNTSGEPLAAASDSPRINRLLYGCSCNMSMYLGGSPTILFNTSFPSAAYEDIELCLRAADQGVNVSEAPSATVFHRYANCLSGVFKQFRRYGRNEHLVLQHHPNYLSHSLATSDTISNYDSDGNYLLDVLCPQLGPGTTGG